MIPTYKIKINPLDNETGVYTMSLVEDPAVQIDFLKFANESPIEMTFSDDERHIISGVALLADTPIYRRSEEKGEYNVIFEKDTIRDIVTKFFKFHIQNTVDLNHNEEPVDNVTLFESYIIDKERGVNPLEFKDVPDGSWIVSYKVNNLDVWEKIKAGELNGFSIGGLFQMDEKFSAIPTQSDELKNEDPTDFDQWCLNKLNELENDKQN